MILDETLKNLEVGIRGGGNLVSHRPFFTKDSRHVIVVSGDTVQIYSTESGDCVGIVQIPTPSSIANVILSQPARLSSVTEIDDSDILIILTEAGDLFHVSLHTYEITSTQNINRSVPKEWTWITKWLNITHLKAGTLLLQGHTENEEEVMLYQATQDLDSKKGRYHLEKICWRILPTSHAVAVGASGQLVTAIQNDSVFMTNITSKGVRWHKSGTRAFTCVAAHPHDWIVATGDDSGRVLLWRNFMEEKSPAKAVFHWHSLPVADLCFSTDGSKLLSGGGECCLVRWDTADASDRKILPRLGLPIRHIAISNGNALVAVSHADNCIQLVDDGNKVVRVIQNITQCYIPEGEDDENVTGRSLGGDSVFQAGLTVDPNRKSVVMNGKPGHLQCYSLREDKHLYSMDITQQNYVTADRKKPIPNADVTHVAFSSHGVWLSTVESLVSEGKGLELRLKFWKFDESKQLFVLNTSINWPHENGIVNLKIQPGDEKSDMVIAATSGHDKRFKTWGLVQNTSVHGKSEWWTCENMGSYREQSAGPLTFSYDGSVLAVPFGHTITLWKVDTHELTGTLCHSKLKEDIKLSEFSAHPTSSLLVCATCKDLIVWDVITLSLMWRVPLAVESIAVDGLSNLVTVFSNKRHLYFFKPDVPEPLAVHKNVSRSKIISSIFVPNPYAANDLPGTRSTLIFLNSSQELCAMIPRDRSDNVQKTVKIRKGISTLTPFAKLLADKTVSSVNGSQHSLHGKTIVGIPGAHVIRQMMDISPQTMPSISYYCNQLLSAISVEVKESDKMDSIEESLDTSTRKLYDNFSSSDSESESDEDENQGQDNIFSGFGRRSKANQERKKSLVEGNGLDTSDEPPPAVTAVTGSGGKNALLRVDLDSVANDDISWIEQSIAPLKNLK